MMLVGMAPFGTCWQDGPLTRWALPWWSHSAVVFASFPESFSPGDCPDYEKRQSRSWLPAGSFLETK